MAAPLHLSPVDLGYSNTYRTTDTPNEIFEETERKVQAQTNRGELALQVRTYLLYGQLPPVVAPFTAHTTTADPA